MNLCYQVREPLWRFSRYEVTKLRSYNTAHFDSSFAFLRSVAFGWTSPWAFSWAFPVGFVLYCILEPSWIYRLAGCFHVHDPSALLGATLDIN